MMKFLLIQACCVLHLVKQVLKLQTKGENISSELLSLFVGELNPVAPKAQKKVPIPEGCVYGAFKL